jgi:hypothetical protein
LSAGDLAPGGQVMASSFLQRFLRTPGVAAEVLPEADRRETTRDLR